MKTRKRFSAILAGTIIMMALSGCGSSESSGSTVGITSEESSVSADGGEENQNKNADELTGTSTAAESRAADGGEDMSGTTTDTNAPDTTITTIEEQVVLDAENVKITATEYIEDDIWGDGIKLLIENNGTDNIGVSSNATIVNNYMINDLFSSQIAAGKKANDTLYLSSSQLKSAGIENIGQIEIYFHLYNSDSYETIYDADKVTIKTNKFDVMDTEPNDDGHELYNEEGIRIVGKYVDEDSIWGNAIVLYLENNTNQNVIIQCDDMSVNGFMVTPLFSCDVYAGKMAISDITLLQSDLDENNITSVDEVELKFHIVDADSYETIKDTDPITFSTK